MQSKLRSAGHVIGRTMTYTSWGIFLKRYLRITHHRTEGPQGVLLYYISWQVCGEVTGRLSQLSRALRVDNPIQPPSQQYCYRCLDDAEPHLINEHGNLQGYCYIKKRRLTV